MAGKNNIDIALVLSNYQQFRKEIMDSISYSSRLKQEFDGVSTSVDGLEKELKLIEEVISILTTKVSSDGKMSIKTSRELLEIFEKLNNSAMSLEREEGSRLSDKKFRERLAFLTDENSAFAKATEELKQQTAELEKQQETLEKRSKLSGFLKNKKTNLTPESLEVIQSTPDEVLRSLVSPTKKGNYTKERLQKLSDLGITFQEQAMSIFKLYEKMDEGNQKINKNIDDINKKIKQSTQIIEAEQKKINELYNTGIYVNDSSAAVRAEIESDSPIIRELTEEATKANKATIDLNASTAKTPSTFQQATKAIISSRLVLQTLRKIMNEAVRTIREMDKALTGMTAVTGKSREEVLELIPTLKKLAQQTSSTMTDVANLTTEYLRQGRSMEDALELAKETAKAAQIAEISTSDSLTYMTSAINGFNLAASDAAHVSDVFANVAAKTATDYEQLAVALSKVSAQANLAGMSMEYTTALLAKGIETTQEAPESIGTALKTIIARMRELTDYNKVLEDGTSISKVERALASAGIALRDQNGAFRDLEAIFNELGPQWDTLNTMQQQAIAQAVAGTRQQSRFVAIMQDWERTMESVTIAEESAGAAAYQYSKMAEGLGATITNLTTSWQGFTASLVDTEFVIDVLKGVTNFLNNLSEMSGL